MHMTTKTTSEIVYPETDGMPLPDGVFQDPLFREEAELRRLRAQQA